MRGRRLTMEAVWRGKQTQTLMEGTMDDNDGTIATFKYNHKTCKK